ncbi:hypothetical protein [Eudoraea sp.]|uniref:hypothetical protein n=1 Tax=Eudoraea sp. TaxID=1979955 RepID=UPI003C718CE4
MKSPGIPHFIVLALLGTFLLSGGFENLHAQDAKKNSVRLKADYFKIMEGEIYIKIKATSKIENQNIEVPNLDITVYNEVNDEEIVLGNTITNNKGESRFIIENLNTIKADSTNTYNLGVSFKGNEAFKRASRSISFKNADIKANLVKKDSINYISATLSDTSADSVLAEKSLVIQVQRLFSPLKIGEEFNFTDENGTIFVPIEDGIPGLDGNLNIEVVLQDSDDYGTVKAIINAPIGKPIVEESTFDQRTLWSPRSKTPIFILFFTGGLIFGTWGIIIYLITNLFKISKN